MNRHKGKRAYNSREEIKIRFYPNNPMTISNNRKLYPGCNPRKISNIQRDILYPHINRNSPPNYRRDLLEIQSWGTNL